MEKLKIIFISSQPPVNGLFEDLLPILNKNGVDTTLLSHSPLLRDRISELDLSKIRQLKAPLIKVKRKNITIRIFNLIIFWIFAFFKIIVRPNDELIFFGSQPPFICSLGLVSKMLTGRRYLCLVNDLYPNILKQTGLLSQRNPIYKILNIIMIKSLNGSEKNFVIGRCMKKVLLSEGVRNESIELIQNWSDEEFIKPIERSKNILYHKDYGFKTDDFYILYSGNMGIAHNFDLIFEVAKEMQHFSKVKFIFVGSGQRKIKFQKLCLASDLKNCIFIDPVPYRELPYFLSIAHVHFICLRSNFSGLVVPSKFYSSLAVGRPVIYNGPLETEIARSINEHSLGLVVSDGEHKKAVRFITDLVETNTNSRSVESRITATSKKHFSKSEGLKRYVHIILKNMRREK